MKIMRAKLRPGQSRITAQITRADGTVENLGVVSSPIWYERLAGSVRILLANVRHWFRQRRAAR